MATCVPGLGGVADESVGNIELAVVRDAVGKHGVVINLIDSIVSGAGQAESVCRVISQTIYCIAEPIIIDFLIPSHTLLTVKLHYSIFCRIVVVSTAFNKLIFSNAEPVSCQVEPRETAPTGP